MDNIIWSKTTQNLNCDRNKELTASVVKSYCIKTEVTKKETVQNTKVLCWNI